MKNESFISFSITCKKKTFNGDNFLSKDFRKQRILFIKTTLRTQPFTKV